jgi:hypothetical protein
VIDRPVKVGEAIHSLVPSASFTVYANDYDQVIWDSEDIEKPSREDVEAEMARMEAEKLSFMYREHRKNAYPPIGDQLDALYHAGVFPPEMAEKIRAVKESFPKPTEP